MAKFSFPEGLYTDVRIEHAFAARILFSDRRLDECKEKRYSAAFIRVYDGRRWYYSSTSDLTLIDEKIAQLAAMAAPMAQGALEALPIYAKFSNHKDKVLRFAGDCVADVPLSSKLGLLQSMFPLMEASPYIKQYSLVYIDEYTRKEFYSSKGADLELDYQRCGFRAGYSMADGDNLFREGYSLGKVSYAEIAGFEEAIRDHIAKSEHFLLHNVPVEPGKYTVIFAPICTGVFAHECFGHKSESDFMVGDEASKKEWTLGKPIGFHELSIIDTGTLDGNGWIPYDDEGNKATKTHLIKDGVLTGRLHHCESALDLGEEVTGNGRAINFEYEPIVRMTTTYIDKGSKTREALIAETKEGILVEDLAHGSGMSTFTIAPTIAYYIKDGKIDKPVRISVISGNVFEALGDIDGISDEVVIGSFVTGGCGKMEQAPLPVGFGGPYIRVKNLNVQ